MAEAEVVYLPDGRISPEIRISPSKISAYLQCPALFRLQYTTKFHEKPKEIKSPVTVAGSFVHKALELLAKSILPADCGGTAAPGTSRVVTRDMALHWLGMALRATSDEGWKPQTPLSVAAVRLASETMEACWPKLDFSATIAVERPWRVNLGPLDPHDLSRGHVVATGIFDRVERLPDGALIVGDWKTGFEVMSREEAEGDYQVNCYLVGAKAEFAPNDDVDIGFRLDYLTRGVRVGPVRWSPFLDQWIRRLTTAAQLRISEEHAWQETPGHPQCTYCPRQTDCTSFKRLLTGPLRAVGADPKVAVREYDKLRALIKVADGLKEQAAARIKTEIRASQDGKPVMTIGYRAGLTPIRRTEFLNFRRTATAAAKAIFDAEAADRAEKELAERRLAEAEAADAPPVVSVDDLLKTVSEALSETLRHATGAPEDAERLTKALVAVQGIVGKAKAAERTAEAAESRISELADRARKLEIWLEVASVIGDVSNKGVDRLLTERCTAAVSAVVAEAIKDTASDSGYPRLDVTVLDSPFGLPTVPNYVVEVPKLEQVENPLATQAVLPTLTLSDGSMATAIEDKLCGACSSPALVYATPHGALCAAGHSGAEVPAAEKLSAPAAVPPEVEAQSAAESAAHAVEQAQSPAAPTVDAPAPTLPVESQLASTSV